MADILGWVSGLRELVSMLETRSIAETTAANTRIDNLTTAIESLVLGGGTVNVAAPTVNISQQPQQLTVNCGCSGSGGQSPDTPPVDFVDDGESYPSGYNDRASYDAGKCNASQYFLNNWIQDLTWLFSADASALTAGSLGAALLIPGVDVLALIGIVLLLVSIGVFSTSVQNVKDWVNEELAELRCIIYNAGTASEAASGLVEYIENSALTGTEKQIAKYWITPAALNSAFEYSNVPNIGADCSGCNVPLYTIDYGFEEITNLQKVNSVPHPSIAGWYLVGVGFTNPITINSVSYVYGTSGGATSYDINNQIIGNQSELPFSGPKSGVKYIWIHSPYQGQFSVSINWEES